MGESEVAVLGGNGFIGNAIASALERLEHRVLRVVRVPQGPADVQCDVRNLSALGEILKPGMSVVCALPSTSPVIQDKSAYFDSPAFLVPLLRLAEERHVRHFYYCSSGGAVYGNQQAPVCPENSAVRPVSSYGIGKATAEILIREFATKSAIDAVCWRFSNVYGPGQNPNASQGLVAVAVNSLTKKIPLKVFGDGSRVRDYVYVDDAAVAAAKMVGIQSACDVYNVAARVGHSVEQVLRVVENVLGGSIRRRHVGDLPSQVQRIVLDNSLIRREFGPLTFRSLEAGISDYAKFLSSDPDSSMARHLEGFKT